MKEIPVIFKSNNKQLVGILHLPKAKNPPVIINCHGFTGNKSHPRRVWLSRELAKKGYAVLRFDFYGSGDSEGRFEEQTFPSQLKDIKAALKFIRSQKNLNTKKICLLGHSQGGSLVLWHAAHDKSLKTIIAMGPAGNMLDYFSKNNLEEAKTKGKFYLIYDFVYVSHKYFEEVKKFNIYDIVSKIKTPTMVVVGSDDTLVIAPVTNKIYQNLKCKKKLATIKGADHSFNRDTERKKLLKALLDWLSINLK